MRKPPFTTQRRKRSSVRGSSSSLGASALARGIRGRSRSASPTGGPVAPTEYVGRRSRRPGGGTRKSGSRGGASGGTAFPRARRASPVVRRAVLAGLICASVGLITTSYRGGVVIHSTQMALLDVVAPIERGMSRAWDPVAGAWGWSGRLFHATNENPRLERENAKLRADLLVAQQESDDAAEMRRLLDLEDTVPYPDGYRAVHGQLEARASGDITGDIVIDLGSSDGVRVDDPVLDASGYLLGRIVSVGRSNATVGLILDQGQAVTTRVQGADTAVGVLSVVSNEGEPVMQLRFVPQGTKVSQGDRVMTAGWYDTTIQHGSRYPRNIPVGYVSSVGNSPADLYKTVQVTPFADFEHIDLVTVLVPKGERTAVELPPAVSDVATAGDISPTTPEKSAARAAAERAEAARKKRAAAVAKAAAKAKAAAAATAEGTTAPTSAGDGPDAATPEAGQ